jgi:tRNA (guanine-N7-)-methyltransferase
MKLHAHSHRTAEDVAAYAAEMERRRRELKEQVELILPADSRFTWELGSGHGHFLTAYAAAHPAKLCVGVDMELDRIDRALRKSERAGLRNLHFVRAEARLFLQTLPAGVRMDEVFILFPDPWPKLRHHKHRIVQPEFLSALATHAADGCALFFRTDFLSYFEHTRATIERHPDWTLVEEPWPFEFTTVFQARAAKHHSLVARRRPRAERSGGH